MKSLSLEAGWPAGLMAARGASKSVDTAVLSKVYPTRSHSGTAQGGSNAALGEDDSIEAHIFDAVKTLRLAQDPRDALGSHRIPLLHVPREVLKLFIRHLPEK
jgi:hypothetical protein